jgi:hypothetical protein
MAVVPVQVFVDEERIIIIVQNPSMPDPSSTQGDQGRMALTTQHSGGSTDATQNDDQAALLLKQVAKLQAGYYFTSMEQQVKEQYQDWPPLEVVERAARKEAYDYLRTSLDKLPLMPEANVDTYVKTFVDTFAKCYESQYKQATGDGSLPDEKMQRLVDLARKDAQHDHKHPHEYAETTYGVEEQVLNVQAALRVQDVYTFLKGFGTGQIPHIMSLAEKYKRFYREETRRLTRPAPFPGTSGQPGPYAGA